MQERHDAGDDSKDQQLQDNSIVSKWRQKEKLKTTAVALVLCLNIGVDPPDVIKISPCARLECWVDPLSMQPAKALETIGVYQLHVPAAHQRCHLHCMGKQPVLHVLCHAAGPALKPPPHFEMFVIVYCSGKNLQAQYERWQPRAKYKMHLDPTMEDVKKLCISCRRTAKVGGGSLNPRIWQQLQASQPGVVQSYCSYCSKQQTVPILLPPAHQLHYQPCLGAVVGAANEPVVQPLHQVVVMSNC